MRNIAYIITKNGSSGYLFPTIERLEKVTDYILVSVDGTTTDNTLEDCKECNLVDDVISHDMDFSEEHEKIRGQAYEYALDKNPDADKMVALDDDEIIPNIRIFRRCMNYDAPYNGVILRHLWKDYSYRCDGTWHNVTRVVIKDLNKTEKGEWGQGTHGGRIPFEKSRELGTVVPILHFGWDLPPEKRKKKMRVKEKRDDDPIDIQKKHYQSLDKDPKLREVPKHWKRLIDKYGHRYRS